MARDKKSSRVKKGKMPSQLKFDYIKSNFFRIVYADGIYGGPTPRGSNLQMVFWSQRQAIPQQVIHKVNPDTGP